MPFPAGLPSKTLTFGRYSSALGSSRGGTVKLGFDKAMLHVPTGEVVTFGMDSAPIGADTGAAAVTVPVTVTPDLLMDWTSATPMANQRLRIEVAVPGYPAVAQYVDIHPDDPPVIDFDHLEPYAVPGGLPVARAAVASVAGLTGVIEAGALETALGMREIPYAASAPVPAAGRAALLLDPSTHQLRVRLPDGSYLAGPVFG